jgi:AraC-like DNA-binding protein
MRPPSLPGVEIIGMCDGRLPGLLYSERYGIIICGNGGSNRRRGIGGHRSRCQPILLEPGEVQASALACTCVGVWALFIEPSVLVQFAAGRGLARTPGVRITGSQYTPLAVAAGELCAAVEQNVPASKQQGLLANCLQCLLDLMVEPAPRAHGTHPAVTAAQDYLRRRVHETVTLDELASISRMSRFHLARAFAARVGLPPHAYQTRLRVERAMELLRAGLRPGEVANLTGFADQSHLTRHFRRIMGVTPGEYAQGA